MPNNSFLGTEMQPDYVPTSDEKTMAILSHILTLIAPILAPLIIYLIKKDESDFIRWHARESLNFQITVGIVCCFRKLSEQFKVPLSWELKVQFIQSLSKDHSPKESFGHLYILYINHP